MTTLLSRVAEQLYWSARYLERAEDTARVVREHTNLIVDMPTSVMSSWEPLLAVTGSSEAFARRSPEADEPSIVGFLVSDRENPGSIHSSVEAARENLRSCREVLPATAWIVINDLHLYVAAHHHEGVARRSRTRFCDHVVAEHQRVIGILTTMMTRDAAYTMLRLGRHIERADMATRVLDVTAGTLLAERADDSRTADLYDSLRWSAMLRSLSAAQMHQRARRGDVAETAVDFVLNERSFPRSVRYCLEGARESARLLPRPEEVTAACDAVLAELATIEPALLDAAALHDLVDRLQIAIHHLHDLIHITYFGALHTEN